MYGVEKTHHKNLKIMRPSRESYGIVVDETWSYRYDKKDEYTHHLTNTKMARGQFSWLVRRGDAMLSDNTEVAEKEFTRTFEASDGGKFALPVYAYLDEDDDLPSRWKIGQHGKSESRFMHESNEITNLRDRCQGSRYRAMRY